jgi:hypothetical protein
MLKIPSSINWLIKKRGRIDGSIQKIERYLNDHRRLFKKYQELTNELSLLKETLESVDTALRLHELKIDPQNIPPINGKNYVTDLPRGELSLLIFERIRMGCGQPVSSKEIVDFITALRQASGASAIPRSSLSAKVSWRLKALCKKGELDRHHSPRTRLHGWWTLASNVTQDIQNQVDDLDYIP